MNNMANDRLDPPENEAIDMPCNCDCDVNVYLDNSHGDIEIVVDGSYDPNSDHAVSGRALAEALKKLIEMLVSKDDFNDHINNWDIHVTKEEKDKWNDSYTREELDDKFENSVDWYEFNQHIHDTDIHVTQEEKNRWNNDYYTKEEMDEKLFNFSDAQDITDHLANGDIHVTKEEKARWNDSYTKEELDEKLNQKFQNFESNLNSNMGGLSSQVNQLSNDLSAHIRDTTVHITAAERNTWNKKMDCTELWTKLAVVRSGEDIEALSKANPTTMYVSID